MEDVFHIRSFMKHDKGTYGKSPIKKSVTKKILKQLKAIEEMLTEPELHYEETLNRKKAAIYLGISESQLYRLNRKNKIHGYKDSSGQWCFKKEELNRWVSLKWPVAKIEMSLFRMMIIFPGEI